MGPVDVISGPLSPEHLKVVAGALALLALALWAPEWTGH